MLSDDAAADAASTAAQQFGLVTTGQLDVLGVDHLGVRRLTRRGSLTGLARGVYRSPFAPENLEQLAYAACLVNGAEAAVSHFTAAALYKLDVAAPNAALHITVPAHRSRNSLGGRVIVHRSAHFDARDRKKPGRIQMTSVTRTIADIAPELSQRRTERVVDDALARRLLRPQQLLRFLERPEARRRPGRVKLLAALEPWIDGTAPTSVAEADALRLFEREGIDRPVCQYPIRDGGRVVAKVDFAWPAERVLVEINGFRYHSGPGAAARDSERLSEIQAAGWVALGAMPTQLERSPAPFMRSLRTHLALARGGSAAE